MIAHTKAAPESRRLTAPTFRPDDIERIRQAAKAENRSVSGLIAHATITYAAKVLATKE